MLGLEVKRRELNWTRANLAEKLGVAVNTVFRWEKGERNPNMVTLKRLAKIFNVSIDCLVYASPTQQVQEKKTA